MSRVDLFVDDDDDDDDDDMRVHMHAEAQKDTAGNDMDVLP